ncbi:MAG: hypothetical protein HFI58_08040 [Lachnospiraceae bacterium]|nr:hypothetical protein [Lachnospiraceae bacterium]MCI9254770.1 hypothetical protein [Lachnospiraceae bacterium]
MEKLFSCPVKRKKLVLATGSLIHIAASDIPYGNWLFWVELFLSAAAMVSICRWNRRMCEDKTG